MYKVRVVKKRLCGIRLRKHQKCRNVPPEWMDIELLEEIKEAKKKSKRCHFVFVRKGSFVLRYNIEKIYASHFNSFYQILLGCKCMYFGLSFSSVGADFRALMASIFVINISELLATLEMDLQHGITSFDTVLGQRMYFGLSFNRVDADFRALIAPIFVKVIREKFVENISIIQLEKYTLINKATVHTRSNS
uniref:Conserved oligomeric Golgi complex subunit 8 n=1 Tax=Glossina austeni TaxID=7395 RepID=A0A1A9VXS3_GLOAU